LRLSNRSAPAVDTFFEKSDLVFRSFDRARKVFVHLTLSTFCICVISPCFSSKQICRCATSMFTTRFGFILFDAFEPCHSTARVMYGSHFFVDKEKNC